MFCDYTDGKWTLCQITHVWSRRNLHVSEKLCRGGYARSRRNTRGGRRARALHPWRHRWQVVRRPRGGVVRGLLQQLRQPRQAGLPAFHTCVTGMRCSTCTPPIAMPWVSTSELCRSDAMQMWLLGHQRALAQLSVQHWIRWCCLHLGVSVVMWHLLCDKYLVMPYIRREF